MTNNIIKSQILNFSVAYGKTAHGLSKDFNVSHEEGFFLSEKPLLFCNSQISPQ